MKRTAVLTRVSHVNRWEMVYWVKTYACFTYRFIRSKLSFFLLLYPGLRTVQRIATTGRYPHRNQFWSWETCKLSTFGGKAWSSFRCWAAKIYWLMWGEFRQPALFRTCRALVCVCGGGGGRDNRTSGLYDSLQSDQLQSKVTIASSLHFLSECFKTFVIRMMHRHRRCKTYSLDFVSLSPQVWSFS